MVIQDNSGAALIWLLISLVVFWLIIYSAVRAAVGHALDRREPRLIAQAHQTAEGVHFIVSNGGTGPAFHLSVRWSGRPADEVLAGTPLLGRTGTLQWTLAAEPTPDDVLVIGLLKAEWNPDLDSVQARRSGTLAVLVPSRLVPAK
jgi:hypothetical protein